MDVWLGELEQHASPNSCKILVGNKLDLQEKRQVTREEIEAYAAQKNISYVECSSLTGENVDDVKENVFFKSLDLNLLKVFVKLCHDILNMPGNERYLKPNPLQ